MSSLTLGVPFVVPFGNSGTEPKKWREFSTSRSFAEGMSEPLAEVIRDSLNSSDHEPTSSYTTLPTERLVEQDELILAIPDDVWRRHGFYPMSPWKEKQGVE